MAESLRVRVQGDALIASDAESIERVRRLDAGADLVADVKQPRNYRRLKRAFALINLAFDYWEPDTMVSRAERQTVNALGDFLISRGLNPDTVYSLCNAFLNVLEHKRSTTEADKSPQGFRDFVTIEAGHYYVTQTPGGPKRQPRSWSFAATDEEAFRSMYSDLHRVCWNLALCKQFDTPEQSEAAVQEMMRLM